LRAGPELAQRRGEDADRVGAEPLVGERGPAPAQRRPGRAVERQHAAAERPGARDQTPVAVDDLDEQRAAAEPALERAGCGEHGRGRGGQARDLGGAPAQRLVERAVQAVVEPREDGDAEQDDGDDDGDRRGRGHAGAEGDRPHALPSRKPSPRTVWMIGGSPSLRRR
jgi:hypothetical protein